MIKRYAILMAVSVVFAGCSKMASFTDSKEVKMVKAGVLRSCPTATLEQMVEGFMTSTKWESGANADGEAFVNVNGDVFMQGKKVRARIQFLINKDQQGYKFNAFELNDIPQAAYQASGLLAKMCESAGKNKGSVPPMAVAPSVTIASEEDMKNYAQGVWTCNWLPTTQKPKWSKFVFNVDGSGERYDAPVVADDWGKAVPIKWETLTNKDRTTGKRFYGVKVPDPKKSWAAFIFLEEGNDILKSDDNNAFKPNTLALVQEEYVYNPNLSFEEMTTTHVIPCNHEDAFPFSK